MSQLPLACGEDLMCFVDTDGGTTFKPIAGQKNVTITKDVNYRDVANKNQGKWKDHQEGKKGWSASVDIDVIALGSVDNDEYNFQDLQDAEFAGTKLDVVFCWVTRATDSAAPVIDTTKRKYTGKVLVSVPPTAGDGENISTTVAMQGCQQLNIVDPT